MARVRVCAVNQLAPGAMTRVCVGSPIAVYNVEGRFYATDDTCTHGEGSLSEGTLNGAVIECGWHRGRFSVVTGAPVRFPATRPLRTYPTLVEGDDLYVEIDEAPTVTDD